MNKNQDHETPQTQPLSRRPDVDKMQLDKMFAKEHHYDRLASSE